MAHTNEVERLDNTGWDERIIVVRNGRLVQTFIILTERFVVLVDTLINPQTAAQLLALAAPHLDPGRQLLVLNTHADYDHCWGNQLFAGPEATHPAPILGHQETIPQFQHPDSTQFLAQMQEQEPAIFAGVVPTPPTLLFRDCLTIDGGDLTLELLYTPGHTPDHVAVYLPEIDTLLAADAAEIPYPAARTPAGLPQMRASLARLAALEPAVVLYCHAPADYGPQLLRDNIAYFDYVEACCRRALARGVPPDPPPDADLIALVDCPYAAGVPAGGPWESVHDYYRTAGHAAQIRTMLHALRNG